MSSPWPWRFVDLDAAQKHARRETINHYATVAHLSTVLPVLVGAAYQLCVYAVVSYRGRRGGDDAGGGGRGRSGVSVSRGTYAAVPGSPALKHRQQHQRLGPLESVRAGVRRWMWSLGGDVVLFGERWGQWDQWVFGMAWMVWLLVLSVLGTGDDYLHLTKRLGLVAISQFPMQYVVSLKQLNPVAYALGSSHEAVNRIHRPLGRIVYALLLAHAGLYLNFYYQTGVLQAKLTTSLVPILGMVATVSMTLLMGTSMRLIRRLSYQVFFAVHLVVALALPVAVFVHAHTARAYVVEALLAFLADIGARKLGTVEVPTAITRVGDTDLLRLDMTLPDEKTFARFAGPDAVGAHTYLHVPQGARPSPGKIWKPRNVQFEMLFNPFSIADADEKTRRVTLVARRYRGPMTGNFDRLADAHSGVSSDDDSDDDGDDGGDGSRVGTKAHETVPLCIQGPFGCSRKFPDFAGPEFGAVLLVAGGVGATFILPIYRALVAANGSGDGGEGDLDGEGDDGLVAGSPVGDGPRGRAKKVKMIWAVRNAAEATWATITTTTSPSKAGDLMSDDNVEIFLTGSILSSSAAANSRQNGQDIPLSRLPNNNSTTTTTTTTNNGNYENKRPDLPRIVDDLFRKTPPAQGKVAVLVCGPAEMARQLRASVGVWVQKGREVWWHDEGFTW